MCHGRSTEFDCLDREVVAAESRASGARVVSHDGLNGSVETRAKDEETAEHHEDVENSHERAGGASPQSTLVHVVVSNGEEDESEP